MNERIAALALGAALTAGLTLFFPPLAHAQTTPAASAGSIKRADLRDEVVSAEVRHIADWVVHSGDHQRLPFIVVDKMNARAVAFDRGGRMIASTPVLLGMGVGDAFAAGVSSLDMNQTKPWQRITPAGRFHAEEDLNLQGERVLWVDYDNGIALHKLSPKKTKQRRHERMRSLNPADKRITYGCVNVPPAFYERVVGGYFRAQGGFVYVLPDTASLKTVFKSYEVDMGPAVGRMQSSAGQALPQTRKF